MSHDMRRLFELFGAYSDGIITEAEHRELQECLRSDPQARELWFLHNDIDVGLHQLASVPRSDSPGLRVPVSPLRLPVPKIGLSWLQYGALAAVLVGLVIGLFSAGVLWAHAGLHWVKAARQETVLVKESFERSDVQVKRGFPTAAGVWGGNAVELSFGDGAVQAKDGRGMLRMNPVPLAKFSHVNYVVDLAAEPMPPARGTRMLVFSASMRSAATAAFPSRYTVRVAALAEAPEDVKPLWFSGSTDLSELALAFVARNVDVTEGAHDWQTVTATLEVPADTRSVVFSLGAAPLAEGAPKTAYYLDDVRLVMVTEGQQQ